MSSSYNSNSGSGSSGVNVFTPDTPDSGDWQQYRCSHCDLPKRVAVKPSMAKPTLTTGCERCGTQTQHRADGGAALPMIDLTKNPDIPPAAVLGGLRAGRTVRTPVTNGGVHVTLTAGDEACSACDELIPIDDFGEGAPFFRLLATQSKRHGATYCEDCLSEATGDE